MTSVPAVRIQSNQGEYLLRDRIDPLAGLVKYQVQPDWLTHRWNFAVRPVAPAPAVFPVSATPDLWPDTSYCALTERWQYFWVDLLAMAKYGKLLNQLDKADAGFVLKAFKGLTSSTAFLNNYKGTDRYHNYPGRENVTKPDPQCESLICAGNAVYSESAPVRNRRGKWMIQILTFKVYDAPPPVTRETLSDPRVHVATTVKRNQTMGYFGHLGLNVRVPFPLLTKSPAWYPLEDVEPL